MSTTPFKYLSNYKSLNARYYQGIQSPRAQRQKSTFTSLLLKKKSKSNSNFVQPNSYLTKNQKSTHSINLINSKKLISKTQRSEENESEIEKRYQINKLKKVQKNNRNIEYNDKQTKPQSPTSIRIRTPTKKSFSNIKDKQFQFVPFQKDQSQNKHSHKPIINLQIDTTNLKQLYKSKKMSYFPQTTKTIMQYNKVYKKNKLYTMKPYEETNNNNNNNNRQLIQKDKQSIGNLQRYQMRNKFNHHKNNNNEGRSYHNSERVIKEEIIRTSLSIRDFHVIKQLGRGQNGRIYSARHKATGMIVALKHFQQDKLNVDYLIDEMKIQLFCDHPNILKAYGYIIQRVKMPQTTKNIARSSSSQDQYFYNIFLVMQKGQYNLFSLIKNSRHLSEDEAVVYTEQIMSGLVYLHHHKIIHRDIKPENIIIVNGVCKITDFGWSVIGSDERETFCGTLQYMSPEVALGARYDKKIDIWSIGVLIYEMLSGNAPYNTNNILENPCLQFKKKILQKLPKDLSRQCRQLLQRLLELNPNSRITLQSALSHSWVSERMLRKTVKKNQNTIKQEMQRLLRNY